MPKESGLGDFAEFSLRVSDLLVSCSVVEVVVAIPDNRSCGLGFRGSGFRI